MSDPNVETIVEEVKALPPEQQEILRDALQQILLLLLLGEAAQIMKKTLTLMPDDMRRLRDALNTLTLDLAGPGGRAQMVRSIRGKYAHLPTSSEAFAARKAEEIKLEDRRSRP